MHSKFSVDPESAGVSHTYLINLTGKNKQIKNGGAFLCFFFFSPDPLICSLKVKTKAPLQSSSLCLCCSITEL